MGKHLEFTLNQIVNYLTDKFSDEFEMSKAETKRYIIDALSYNIVVEAIREQIEFLLEGNMDETS